MGGLKKIEKADREARCADEALVVSAMAALPGPKCPGCQFSLVGLMEARCPECGRAIRVVVRSTRRLGRRADALVAFGFALILYPLYYLSRWCIAIGWIKDEWAPRVRFGPMDAAGIALIGMSLLCIGYGFVMTSRRYRCVGQRRPRRDMWKIIGALVFEAVVMIGAIRIKTTG